MAKHIGYSYEAIPNDLSDGETDKIIRGMVGEMPAEKYNKIVDEMEELQYYRDKEQGHWLADQLLCKFVRDLGYDELIDAFEDIDKWYA